MSSFSFFKKLTPCPLYSFINTLFLSFGSYMLWSRFWVFVFFFFLSFKLQTFFSALAKFKKLFPKVEEGPVLKDLVWMTSWEFCLTKSAGLGFGKRIKHISLIAIIDSWSKFQTLKIKISHLLSFIGVRKMSPLRSSVECDTRVGLPTVLLNLGSDCWDLFC